MRKFAIFLSGIIFIAGCNKLSREQTMSMATDELAPQAGLMRTESKMISENMATPQIAEADKAEVTPIGPVIQKKIIRDGQMTIKVKDLFSARKNVDSLAKALGGYIGNESFNSYDQESNYNLVIRVPAANFERLIAGIENSTKGEILFKEINARDVTEEFIDLETRLANKRKFIERYGDMLKKASTVKDMLEIEENIRKIEEELESTEGRLRYLTDQVNYSRLNLTLTQEKAYKYKPQYSRNFIERLKESLHKGWKGFIGFLLFIIKIWPLWLLGAVVWIIYRRIKARKHTIKGFTKNKDK